MHLWEETSYRRLKFHRAKDSIDNKSILLIRFWHRTLPDPTKTQGRREYASPGFNELIVHRNDHTTWHHKLFANFAIFSPANPQSNSTIQHNAGPSYFQEKSCLYMHTDDVLLAPVLLRICEYMYQSLSVGFLIVRGTPLLTWFILNPSMDK